MVLPFILNSALERFFSQASRSHLISAANELTQRYRSQDRDKLGTFMTSDLHRLAYLAVRMPATFAVVKKVLQECKNRLRENHPKTVCDIGAGPGTASWAAVDVFPEIEAVTLHEKDIGWLKLGKSLMEESLVLKKAFWKETDLLQQNDFILHDLVILSYVIGELPIEKMSSLAVQAWNTTAQLLVVIEPGTPHGFERIRLVRDQLIKAGAYIVSPCPHHGECPMKDGDWCHFAVRLERSSLHMSVKDVTMGYEDEKYAYIVFSKTTVELPEARILRHPQHHSGHTEFVLCSKEGLEKRTISRRHKDVYKRAKKLDWGDVIDG